VKKPARLAAAARLRRRADQSGSLEWYHRVVGEDRCPIVDTWWQTETGGILIAPLRRTALNRIGDEAVFRRRSRNRRRDRQVLEGACEGNL